MASFNFGGDGNKGMTIGQSTEPEGIQHGTPKARTTKVVPKMKTATVVPTVRKMGVKKRGGKRKAIMLGGAAAGDGAFNYASIPNLVSWYDPNELAGADGTVINAIPNRVLVGDGGTDTLSRGSGGPKLRTNLVNGKKALHFDTANSQALDPSINHAIFRDNTLTCFGVVRHIAGAGPTGFMGCHHSLGGAGSGWNFALNPSSEFASYNVNGYSLIKTPLDANWHIMAIRSGPANTRFYDNGNLVTTGGSVLTFSGSASFALGKFYFDTVTHPQFYFAKYLQYNRRITDSEFTQVINALKADFGIT